MNQVVKWISVTASAAALISVVGCGTGAGNNATNANNATNTAGGGTCCSRTGDAERDRFLPALPSVQQSMDQRIQERGPERHHQCCIDWQ